MYSDKSKKTADKTDKMRFNSEAFWLTIINILGAAQLSNYKWQLQTLLSGESVFLSLYVGCGGCGFVIYESHMAELQKRQ